MDYQNILVSLEGGITTVTVNRPEKMNALNAETIDVDVPANAEIIVEGHDGKTYKKTLADASKRVDGGGMTAQ